MPKAHCWSQQKRAPEEHGHKEGPGSAVLTSFRQSKRVGYILILHNNGRRNSGAGKKFRYLGV